MSDEFVSYEEFAEVYDELMDDVPYDMWSKRIIQTIERYGISKPVRDVEDVLASERNLVLDLGCGTGTLTELLYDAGYDMIGVDNSEAMLRIAMNKKAENGKSILYLLQDMRELSLYSTIGTVVSVCDSVNYITEPGELLEVFRLVNNYLYPGGLFIFDFNTTYKYAEVMGDTTIAENREDVSFIWENFYDPDTCINEYDLTLFVKNQNESYSKFSETHVQRGYTPQEIKELLQQAGLVFVDWMDAETEGPVTETTERVYVVARENGKEEM